jgi:hypothetical protein
MSVVRLAEARDIEFVSQDGYVRPDLLERKIEQGEVLLAEVEGIAAGGNYRSVAHAVFANVATMRFEVTSGA